MKRFDIFHNFFLFKFFYLKSNTGGGPPRRPREDHHRYKIPKYSDRDQGLPGRDQGSDHPRPSGNWETRGREKRGGAMVAEVGPPRGTRGGAVDHPVPVLAARTRPTGLTGPPRTSVAQVSFTPLHRSLTPGKTHFLALSLFFLSLLLVWLLRIFLTSMAWQ